MNRKLILILTLGLIWGINFPLNRYVLLNFDPVELRYLSGMIGLIITVLLLASLKFQPMNLKQLVVCGMIGLPVMAIVPALNIFSLYYINSSTACVLIYTMPAITSFFIFLGMKSERSFTLLIPAILSLTGILCLTGFNMEFGSGEWIILSSAVIWAFGSLMTGKYTCYSSGVDKFLIQLLVASLVTVMIFSPIISYESMIRKLPLINFFQLFSLIFVCGIASCCAFFLWNLLITTYGTESAGYSILLSPMIGVFFGVIFLREDFSLLTLVSLILIVSSIFLQQRISFHNRPKTQPG